MVRHLPSPPWTMLARTAWVWSWGSRLREASCRKVAATVFWSPASDHASGLRVLQPGLGGVASRSRPASACPARSWASTMRPSPPMSAASETDLGAEKVRSRPGRCCRAPSGPLASELPSGPVEYLALQHRLEEVRIDRAGEAEVLRALAGPGARFPVGRVVPGVVAVPLVIGDALGRGRDGADRDDHHSQSIRTALVRAAGAAVLGFIRIGRGVIPLPGKAESRPPEPQPGPRAFPLLPLPPRGIPGPLPLRHALRAVRPYRHARFRSRHRPARGIGVAPASGIGRGHIGDPTACSEGPSSLGTNRSAALGLLT